jgi:hypothetical protein
MTGTYGIGGYFVQLPFSHSWSFNPWGTALELLIAISFCHREVVSSDLKLDFGGVHRNQSRAVSYSSGATSKACGSTMKGGVRSFMANTWLNVKKFTY